MDQTSFKFITRHNKIGNLIYQENANKIKYLFFDDQFNEDVTDLLKLNNLLFVQFGMNFTQDINFLSRMPNLRKIVLNYRYPKFHMLCLKVKEKVVISREYQSDCCLIL